MQPTAHTTTVKIAGTEVSFETGRIARQATGAVLARPTSVLCGGTAEPRFLPEAALLYLPAASSAAEFDERMDAAVVLEVSDGGSAYELFSRQGETLSESQVYSSTPR